jgi:hypothetical protein
MNKQNVFKVLLMFSFCALSLFSCNSKMMADKEKYRSECIKLNIEESWFFDWNRAYECSVKIRKKGLDKALVQKMDFIEGEGHYLRNDLDEASSKFTSAMNGPDCFIKKASGYYLKKMGKYSKEDKKNDKKNDDDCKQKELSDFHRYLSLLAQKSEGAGSVNLDKFHEFYSSVLGSDTPPLLYNIALSAIDESNFKQGYELLRNILARFPEFEKASSIIKELDVKDE